MKTLISRVVFLLITSTGALLHAQSIKIPNDKKLSSIAYSMVHPLHKWDGVSKDVSSIVVADPERKNITQVAVSVKLNTFDSQNANRDSHMIEVAEGLKFPSVTFVSKEIKQDGDKLQVSGTLSFHGKSNEIAFQALRTNTDKQMVVAGGFKLKLTQFGIEPPSLLGLATEDEFELRFSMVYP
ncbi:MAG: YceI family protein [Bacteroidetes bacterium]|nr:YceI family protein [Bacteroidota bacterium]